MLRSDIERVFHEQYGRSVAVLVRVFGDIDLAEDAVQDAFAKAIVHWPERGMPRSPAAWIITTARNRGVDHVRRESIRHERHHEAVNSRLDDESPDEGVVRDDQLRLLFTCCHPVIEPAAQVALTLRLLGGLTTQQIAQAFLVPEKTMAQRLVRAKGKIRDAKIPYRVPSESDLSQRLQSVLAVIYLIFNEAHTATSGEGLVRVDLAQEAIRLGRLLVELMPDEPEAQGLLALMLLGHSRSLERTDEDGNLVQLAQQDRTRWDGELIREGQALVSACLRRNEPGPYQIQAAINAVHSDALSADETDWAQIIALYDELLVLHPSPIAMLNRAVAVAEVDGPEIALSLIEDLPLTNYYLFHAIRADLLRRLGATNEARAAYEAAMERTQNEAELRFLQGRIRSLDELND